MDCRDCLFWFLSFGEQRRNGVKWYLVAMCLADGEDGALAAFQKKYGKHVENCGDWSLRKYDRHMTNYVVRKRAEAKRKVLKPGEVWEINGIDLPRRKRKGIL